jgi:outer membrane protein assembly factor BamB
MVALLVLASGCGELTQAATSSDAAVDGVDAHDAGAAVRDAPQAFDASERSLPDAGPDVARCPSDVIFMAVQSNDISATTTLETFAPKTGTVTELGQIACAGPATPVAALAVDQTGSIYVDVGEERIHRLDTTTFECEPSLPIPAEGLPGAIAYQPLGITFVGDGVRDVLYASFFGAKTLGTVDIDIGAIQAAPDSVGSELAGTGDGRLFVGNDESNLMELEAATGAVVQSYVLELAPDSGSIVTGFAPIAVWEGDIYTFALDFDADGGDRYLIERLRLSDGTSSTVGAVNGVVVGASAATCLPSP